MRFAVALWLVLGWATGCRDRASERGAAPRTVPRDAAVERDAAIERDAAGWPDAAPGDGPPAADARTAAAPAVPAGPVELTTTAMAGPFPTLVALCVAQRCPPPPAYEQPDPDGPRLPRCPDTAPASHVGLGMADPPPPFTEVFLQGIDCGMRRDDDPASYRVVVRRADGFFVSRPVFLLGYNPKYCSEGFEASWQGRTFGRAPAVVLSVTAHDECLTCGKQGYESEAVDLIVAIADARPAPVAFRALITGQHRHQRPAEWISPDSTCPTIDRDLPLAETWLGDTLMLRGAQVWRRPELEDDGSARPGAFEEPFVASSAGSYRFVVPAARRR